METENDSMSFHVPQNKLNRDDFASQKNAKAENNEMAEEFYKTMRQNTLHNKNNDSMKEGPKVSVRSGFES